MKMLHKICFFLLLTTFSSVYGGDCWEGDVDDCRVRVGRGYALAQYKLGVFYEIEQGVRQDYKESLGSSDKGNKNLSKKNEKIIDSRGRVTILLIGCILIIFILIYLVSDFRLRRKLGKEQSFYQDQNSREEGRHEDEILEREWQEKERQEKIRQEKERQERERQEKIRQEKERQERERQEKVRREKERQEKEREERNRREKERQERQEQSRKKREKPKGRNEKDRSFEEILGLSSGWTKSDLKSAYRSKCHQTHPDKWESFPEDIIIRLEEEYKEVQKAYKYLSNK